MLIKDVPKKDHNQFFRGTFLKLIKTGKWVHVIDVVEGVLRYCEPGVPEYKKIEFKDSNVEIIPPKLGYINHPKLAAYAHRVPKRVMFAGPTASTIEHLVPVAHPLMDRYTISDHIQRFSGAWVDTFEGKYPNLVEIRDRFLADKECHSAAFDRQFCITRKGDVYYKGNKTPVGKLTGVADVDAITWLPGFEILKQMVGDRYVESLRASKKAPARRIAGG